MLKIKGVGKVINDLNRAAPPCVDLTGLSFQGRLLKKRELKTSVSLGNWCILFGGWVRDVYKTRPHPLNNFSPLKANLIILNL